MPTPLSRTKKTRSPAERRAPISTRGRGSSPMNCTALSRRFCTTSTSRSRSPHTEGSPSSIVTSTRRSAILPATRASASRAREPNGMAWGGFDHAPDAGELQQLVEQPLHLRHRVGDPAHVRLEALDVALERVSLHEAQEAPYRDQRALEIVRHRVGEPLELGVLRLELADELLALGLGLPALGDVLHRAVDAHELVAARVPHRVAVDAHPAHGAALRERAHLGDHRPVRSQGLHVPRVLLEVVGMQGRQPPAAGDVLLVGVAGDPLEGSGHPVQEETSLRVQLGGERVVGDHLRDQAIPLLARGQRAPGFSAVLGITHRRSGKTSDSTPSRRAKDAGWGAGGPPAPSVERYFFAGS